jgi:hypothetical protein
MRLFDGSELVMGFHPTARGFGWALFEGPNAPIDWGLAYVRGDRNAGCLAHLRGLLERHRPDAVVLERFDRRTGKRASRVGRLCQAVAELAEGFGIAVRVYTRPDVRKALALDPDGTRQQTAERVAEHVHAFRHRLPRERKPWESMDRRLALFSAAALVLTHFAVAGEWA